MPPEIEFTAAPAREDIQAIGALLDASRPGDVPPWQQVPMAFLLRRPDGSLEGGLYGYTQWAWAHVEMLALPPERRREGLGRRLLGQAEAEARARGCTDIHLNTFSWQAKPFYEKLGYREWGVLQNFPPGHARHFMTKRL